MPIPIPIVMPVLMLVIEQELIKLPSVNFNHYAHSDLPIYISPCDQSCSSDADSGSP